jgi:hypothetical protein
MGLASCGVKCLNSSAVFQINFIAGLTVLCPEIPHERQAQKRYSQWYWSRAEGESMEVFFQQSLFQISKLVIFASFDDLCISLPYGEIYESKGICR